MLPSYEVLKGILELICLNQEISRTLLFFLLLIQIFLEGPHSINKLLNSFH